ncbi:Uncharacterised protein [Escherichia coli]|nr:Uncharacterised protein [Escherichia coli]
MISPVVLITTKIPATRRDSREFENALTEISPVVMTGIQITGLSLLKHAHAMRTPGNADDRFVTPDGDALYIRVRRLKRHNG